MHRYYDYHNREVQIGDQVIQLYDGTIGIIQSFTRGGNPRTKSIGPATGVIQDHIWAMTGRWCLLLPVNRKTWQ